MSLHVGQQVICVDDEQAPEGMLKNEFRYDPVSVRRGQHYIIAAVGLLHPNDLCQLPCVLIEENANPIWAHRFRPLIERSTETGIAILRKLLTGGKVKETT